MTAALWADIIGWIGAALILLAYGLLTAERTDARSVFYQVLNVFGSIGLIINALYYGALPSFGLNVVWVGIAFYGLWNGWQARREPPAQAPR
ncbi:MAG: hypothetical protein AAGI71_00535 [Bacteroidota bacterium]